MYPDFDGALRLVQQHGFIGLAGTDGCYCGRCFILGVEIRTHCQGHCQGGCPGAGVHIECCYAFAGSATTQDEKAFRAIGEEVRRQLEATTEGNATLVAKPLNNNW
jgi:hypothetical protein